MPPRTLPFALLVVGVASQIITRMPQPVEPRSCAKIIEQFLVAVPCGDLCCEQDFICYTDKKCYMALNGEMMLRGPCNATNASYKAEVVEKPTVCPGGSVVPEQCVVNRYTGMTAGGVEVEVIEAVDTNPNVSFRKALSLSSDAPFVGCGPLYDFCYGDPDLRPPRVTSSNNCTIKPYSMPSPPPVFVEEPAPVSEDSPCFAAETRACRLRTRAAAPAAAYADCFGGSDGAAAARVRMSDLRAGDLVLDSPSSVARVVVNQHVRSAGTAALLTVQLAHGSLSITPDHVLFVDGVAAPASSVKPGSKLAGEEVLGVSRRIGRVVNPITASGSILAADDDGVPVRAATGNEWLADLMLSCYPRHTLSYTLALLFPASVQAYYDDALEPFFSAAVPTLARLKAAASPAAVLGGLLVGDALLAAGLLVHSALSYGLAAGVALLMLLGAAALSASARKA